MKTKNYKQIFVILAISVFIVPQIVLAAWWNPFSWGIFSFIFQNNKQEQIINTTSSQNKDTVNNSATATTNIPTTNSNQTTPPGTAKATPTVPNSTGGGTSGLYTSGSQKSVPSSSPVITPTPTLTPSVTPTTVNSETEICQKVNVLNPAKSLGNLVSKDVVSLAAQLKTDCSSGVDSNLIKSKWDSYQQLVNWDQSSLVTFVSNPTPSSFRTMCNNANQVKTPFASTKIVLSPDRTSKVLTSVPYTLFDIMMCKDFSEASSTAMTVIPGLLQWDFDSTDSDALRAKIIDYNDMLKKLDLLENGDVVTINNTVIPFIDKTTKHLITAKQGEITMTKQGRLTVTFAVYNPVKWAKKVISSPAEAMVGTGWFDSQTGFTPLVMHTPPDTIISTFQVPIKSSE